MGLPVLPEPKDLKEFIKRVRSTVSEDRELEEIDQDNLAVWYGNKLPKYLWNHWKDALKEMGYSWQKFLRVLKLHTEDFIAWALHDTLNWEELIQKVISTLVRYSRKG